MVMIENWMDTFLSALRATFGNRVWFVGLQGSYARGEATEESDIDVVVILDELAASDLQTYRALLDTLPYRELICGFLSGKREIFQWEASDLFQFCHDTTAMIGSLDEVLALVDEASVDRAIKIGACNIYHACVHNMLHEKQNDILQSLYKAASFVVQAIVFKNTGNYIKQLRELIPIVSPTERMMIDTYLNYKEGRTVDFDQASRLLFTWAQRKLCAVN